MLRWALLSLVLASPALPASLFHLEEAAALLERAVVSAAPGNGTSPAMQFKASLQLQQFSNPGGMLPKQAINGKLTNMTCLNPGAKTGNGQCNYVFVVSLPAFNGNGQLLTMQNTPAYTTSTGSVNLKTAPGLWNTTSSASFSTKPTSLVVNVYHYGGEYAVATPMSPFGATGMALVDSFVADMVHVLPLTHAYSPTGGVTTLNLQGKRSSLQLQFSLRCVQPGASGFDCNLYCTPPAKAGNPAQCTLKMPGQKDDNKWACQSMTSPSNLTVDTTNTYYPCNYCPNGVSVTATNGATCVGASVNPSATPLTTGLVDASYQTATTALAICFVIAGIIVIALVIRMYLTKKKADEAEYVRRRNAWSERPNVELTSKDNKAYNHRPDPDASETETDTSDSHSQSGSSVTGSHTSAGTGKSGSVVVGIPGGVPPADPHEASGTEHSRDSSRRPSEAHSHDVSQHSHPRTASNGSAEHGRTTPRIEARV